MNNTNLSQNFNSSHSYKMAILSSLGAGLEFFDFTLYALFAHYLSVVFFPPQTAHIGALIQTYLILAVGYFARPIGGIILGHLGDKYGRKYSFTYAAFVMATTTFLIGCLPGYDKLGWLAVIFLAVLRLLQGLSLGGEVAGAITFTLEHYQKNRAAWMQSFIILMMCLGSAFAGFLGYILGHYLTTAQMLSWGWRIPFWLGSSIALVSYITRKFCAETPAFLLMKKEKKQDVFPLKTLCSQHFKSLLVGLGLTVFSAGFTGFLLFLPGYLTLIDQKFFISHNYSFIFSTLGFLSLGFSSVLTGYLARIFSPKRLLITGVIASSVVGGVFFILITHIQNNQTALFLPISFCLIVLYAFCASLANGVFVMILAAHFPTDVRYTAIGLCQNLGLGVLGGTAPFIFAFLIHASTNLLVPYFCLLLGGLITLYAVRFHSNYLIYN